MNELKDYILVFKDIMSHKLCEDILKEYANSNEWENAIIGENTIDKTKRNCTSIKISKNNIIEKNKEIRKNLDNEIFECAKKAIKQYNQKFNFSNITKDVGYFLLKYERGGFYVQHVDSFTAFPRTISCSFILNDNFKGGEFSFFNNQYKFNLEKGSSIMFPSNFMYPHSILPVTEGTRYSIVTWFL